MSAASPSNKPCLNVHVYARLGDGSLHHEYFRTCGGSDSEQYPVCSAYRAMKRLRYELGAQWCVMIDNGGLSILGGDDMLQHLPEWNTMKGLMEKHYPQDKHQPPK